MELKENLLAYQGIKHVPQKMINEMNSKKSTFKPKINPTNLHYDYLKDRLPLLVEREKLRLQVLDEMKKENEDNEIKEYMSKNNISSIADFCFKFEANDIKEYLGKILETMMSSVEKGLSTEGKVQAGKKLFINRVAGKLYQDQLNAKEKDKTMLIASFAYAVSEENAAGGELVTAPTCGSAGVLPAVLYYSYLEGKSQSELIGALAAAGIVGNIFKENATIAGAVGGCQAEIGVAVCMAAAALCYLDNLSIEQIESQLENLSSEVKLKLEAFRENAHKINSDIASIKSDIENAFEKSEITAAFRTPLLSVPTATV